MRVIVDSREQCPVPFAGPRYEGVEVVPGSLSVGDYSLDGLMDKVAVERKELPDLVQYLGRERGVLSASYSAAWRWCLRRGD